MSDRVRNALSAGTCRRKRYRKGAKNAPAFLLQVRFKNRPEYSREGATRAKVIRLPGTAESPEATDPLPSRNLPTER